MCFTIYIEERRFFLIYFIKVYSLYVYFPYIYRSIYFFFFSFPPAHSINAYIYSTVQIMVFSLYIRKYCPFFSYISCHSISYRWFSIYISILEIWYFPIYIQTINTFFFLYFAQIVNFCIKTFFFFQFLPRIYVYFYIYSKNTIFSLYFAQNYLYSYFPIYNKHSFSFLDLAQISSQCIFLLYIQTTLFSLVFAQYLSYIMYYSYIQNKHLFFSFFQARYLYIVKFLCFIYILKTIENVYFLIYRRFLFFFFVFPDI